MVTLELNVLFSFLYDILVDMISLIFFLFMAYLQIERVMRSPTQLSMEEVLSQLMTSTDMVTLRSKTNLTQSRKVLPVWLIDIIRRNAHTQADHFITSRAHQLVVILPMVVSLNVSTMQHIFCGHIGLATIILSLINQSWGSVSFATASTHLTLDVMFH